MVNGRPSSWHIATSQQYAVSVFAMKRAFCWHDMLLNIMYNMYMLCSRAALSGNVKDIYDVQLQVLGFELDLDVRYFFPRLL